MTTISPSSPFRDCNSSPPAGVARRHRDDSSQSPLAIRFEQTGTAIPARVFNHLKTLRGARWHAANGLRELVFEGEDCPALRAFEDWQRTLVEDVDDPIVSIEGPAASLEVLNEARSIVAWFAQLRAADFHRHGGDPPIPPPHAALPAGGQNYSGVMALSGLPARIGKPGAGYPAIMALPQHTLICHVRKIWARGTTTLEPVFRSGA